MKKGFSLIMNFNDIIKSTPLIIHGTDVRNMELIIKNGVLLSNKELSERRIKFHGNGNAIQNANKKWDTISVFVFSNEKYTANSCGELIFSGEFNSEEERIEKINMHLTAYDYYFIFNPLLEVINPQIKYILYEGILKTPIKINKANIRAIVFVKDFYLEIVKEKQEYAKNLAKQINKEIKAKGIPIFYKKRFSLSDTLFLKKS